MLAMIIAAYIFYRFNPIVTFVINQNVLPYLMINTYSNPNSMLASAVFKI